MLYRTPDLDADDRRVLREIDAFYADFVKATGGPRPGRWLGGVRKRLISGAVRGSNTIEGYTVGLSAASAIVAGAPVAADVPEDSRAAVAGYRDALTWVMQAHDLGFFQHSEVGLSMLHFMMTRHWPDQWPGRYRLRGIMVSGGDPLTPAYVGPDAGEVPGLMAELVEWLNSGDLDAPMLVRAAMAHLHLASIHPWRDGNGRMSRCLQTLVIARDGRTYPEFCSIEEWLGHDINTLEYYRTFRDVQGGAYQPGRDAHAWVRFNLRAHHLQAQVVTRYLDLSRRLWVAARDLAAARGLGERSITALYAAATLRLRREEYQRDEGLSRDQAIRDIRQLEQAGLVSSVGYGATLAYEASGDLREAADAAAADLTAPAIEPYE